MRQPLDLSRGLIVGVVFSVFFLGDKLMVRGMERFRPLVWIPSVAHRMGIFLFFVSVVYLRPFSEHTIFLLFILCGESIMRIRAVEGIVIGFS